MEIVSGKTGKPHVTSQQFRQLIEGIVGSASRILPVDEKLEPELASNNILKIRSGMMSHHGNVSSVKIGTYDEVELTNGSQGMKRIDLVVNRYTKNAETGVEANDWIVIVGTPDADSPAAPEYTAGNLQEGDLVDDCPVFEIHYDGLNITEVKKLLEIAESNKDLETKIDNIFAPTLTTEGLSAREGRCTIENGGYCMIGNMCFFQMGIKMTVSLSGPNYWTLIDNLPRPQNGSAVACTITGIGVDTAAKTLSLEANSPDIAGSNLVIHNAATISAGSIFSCSGFYLT